MVDRHGAVGNRGGGDVLCSVINPTVDGKSASARLASARFASVEPTRHGFADAD